MKRPILVLLVALLLPTLILAHPHLRKSVTAKVNGSDVTLSYVTVPVNMEHIAEIAVGDFRSGASLNLSEDMQAGDMTISAGDYTVGCVRDGQDAWSMVLYPGSLGRNESPDKSKLIKLASHFSEDMGTTHHSTFDIAPGSGSLSGRAVVVWQFGNLYLTGAIS